jgi:hypothetical protein
LPFSSTENKKFKKMMTYVRPEIKVPGRKKVTEELVPGLAAKVENFMRRELVGVTNVHFAFDNWSSRGHENFLVLCGHFITKDWVLVERVLDFVKYTAGHDADSIRMVVLGLVYNTMEKFGAENLSASDLEAGDHVPSDVEDDEEDVEAETDEV